MRYINLLVLAAALLTMLACEPTNDTPVVTGDQTAGPTRAVMATINDQPVYMDTLVDILVTKYGIAVAQQILANELVDLEAQRLNIVITRDDIAAERDYFLHDLSPSPTTTDSEREQLLQQILLQRDMDENDFAEVLHREAVMRKIIEPTIRISEVDLTEEYGLQFGRKVQVRHIQVESLAQAQQMLKMARNGQDFSMLARQHSINDSATLGGLLPAFGYESDPSELIPPAIRTVALTMDTPGQLSEPVRTDTAYHILYVERIIPPQEVEFERARASLTEDVLKRKIRRRKPTFLAELFMKADIDFKNPILRKQDAEITRQQGR
jgi:foldase protein PrsA